MNESEKININTADEEALGTLPGIAEGLAKRIIEYRENVHPFEEVIELAAVPGVSERMVRKFEDLVTVGDVGDSLDVVGAAPEAVADEIEERLESTLTPVAEESAFAVEPITEEDDEAEEPASVAPPIMEETVEEIEEPATEETTAKNEAETEPERSEEAAVPVVVFASEATSETTESVEQLKEEKNNDMEDKVQESSTPRPVFESTPPPPPPVTSRPAPAAPQPQQSGGGFSWLGVFLGAILGAILALAAVFLLGFARVGYVNQQIEAMAPSQAEVDTLGTTVNTLTSSVDAVSGDLANTRQDLDDLNNNVDDLSTNLEDTTGRVDVLETNQATIDTAVTTAQGDIVTLQESDTVLNGRIDEVAETAETFDTFLLNLRDLLNALDDPTQESAAPVQESAEGEETPPPDQGEVAEPTLSIVELAEADGNFTILLAALDAAGLTETFASEGTYTLFAPTDEVFADLPAGALEALIEDEEALMAILSYHVIDNVILVDDLLELETLTTMGGEDLTVTVTDNGVLLDSAKIIISNLEATNGVIHVIDELLIPASLFEEGSAGDGAEQEAITTPSEEGTSGESEGSSEESGEANEEEAAEPTPIPVTPTPTP